MSLSPRVPTPPPIYGHHVTSDTSLRPYLTLPYLLSLTWLAYPILSLLFVAFRLQLSLSSAQDSVSDAKGNLLASCRAAEHAATTAASLPRFMAIGTNRQIVDAVNSTMNGAREGLILALTVMETIINFIVDTYRSTFLCFLELVVRGGLAILIGAVQEVQQFVQSALGGVRTSIQNDVSTANSAISAALNGINKVLPFGAHINVPQFNIPSLDALNNVTLPTDFEDALIKLNSSIPSLDDLRNKITGFIDTPFELVKKDINDTFLGLSFDESLLPVPELNTLSFCNQLDTGVVDDLGRELVKVARIGTIILIVLAMLLLAGNCLLEWYKWRMLQRHLERTRLAWTSDPTVSHLPASTLAPTLQMTNHNLLVLHATSRHPLLTRLAIKISSLLHLTPSQFIHLQFFFHYVCHPPALACFLIGFFGLLSVELQLLALGPVQAKFSHQVSASVSGFSNTIADSMNASMRNQSALYADAINGHVSTVQTDVNNGLFSWVNGTTSTLNETLVTFYQDIQDAVNTIFGGTILDQPAQDFVHCILGTKVKAFEDALTFLHDHLRVDLPVLNQSVLVITPEQVNEASRPISEAAVGSNGSDGGLVGRLVNRYVSSLKKERIMFGIFMGMWIVVALMALCIIFWHSYGKAWMTTYKRRKWQRDRQGNVDIVITPWIHQGGSNDTPPTRSGKGGERNLTSFTPEHSPEKSGFFAALRKSATDVQRTMSMKQSVASSTPRSPRAEESPGRKPNKLMAIGQKAKGREVLLPDEDIEAYRRGPQADRAEKFTVEVREEKGIPWWRNLWKRRRESIESFESEGASKVPAPQPAVQPRTELPKLTIETNIVIPKSQRDRYPIIIQDSPPPADETVLRNEPTSAWSMSPETTRPTPWARPPETTTFSLRPKAQPNVALPQSVESAYSPSLLRTDTRSKVSFYPPGLSVPIHHGFVRPIPQGTPSSPSPPTSPVRNPNSRMPIQLANRTSVFNATASRHARASSHTITDNPFATCFDDEHRVQMKPSGRRLKTSNGGSSSLRMPTRPTKRISISNSMGMKHERASSHAVDDPFATCFDDEHRVQPEQPGKPHFRTSNPFADTGTPRAV